MVFTLHRYIFREILRVFLLAAVALTVIMSLGSIIQPVQEYGVGPKQVLHLMGYFLPITLTFVLPMAALFATALVYGRFASDNELDACRAGGISMLTMIYPGLVLAVIVAIANLLLSFYVMPQFVMQAQKSFKNDARQILFRNIARRGFYELPPKKEYRIYADYADPEKNLLAGVVLVQVKDARIQKIINSQKANIQFSPHDRFNEVKITAYDTSLMSMQGDAFYSVGLFPATTEFGSLLGDDIKFKTINEMKQIRRDLIQFAPIARLARQAYQRLLGELLQQDIFETLRANPAGFYRMHSGRKIVEFRATQIELDRSDRILLSGDVLAVEIDAATKKIVRQMRTNKAYLNFEGDELAPIIRMELQAARWEKPDGSQGLSRRAMVRGLVVPQAVTSSIQTDDLLQVVSPAYTAGLLTNGPSETLAGLQSQLFTKMQKTLAEIQAELNSRLVFGIGCVLMILIGIALGIIMRGGHLLTAFGAATIPAAILIVAMMTGRNIIKNMGSQAVSGVFIMWGGLGFMICLTIYLYRKLART